MLAIQFTFTFLDFWKLTLRQMQIQYGACQNTEQKRDFLLHLPSFELLVLLFQSLLNSKWGDCCCSDEHTSAFALLSLLFLAPKRFFLVSLSTKESPWFPLMMFPSWYYKISIETIHTLVEWLLPSNPIWFLHIKL